MEDSYVKISKSSGVNIPSADAIGSTNTSFGNQFAGVCDSVASTMIGEAHDPHSNVDDSESLNYDHFHSRNVQLDQRTNAAAAQPDMYTGMSDLADESQMPETVAQSTEFDRHSFYLPQYDLFDAESSPESPINLIGSGAFGNVYHVIYRLTGQEYAMKRIQITRVIDQTKIVEEANVLKGMGDNGNNHVVRYYHCMVENGYFYMKMEYIDGRTLGDIVFSGEAVEENRMLTWLKGILSALTFIHEKGIIHRDIKLDNILIQHSKQIVKVIDFGLAYTHREGSAFAGTKRYSSLNKYNGQKYDYSDDLWAVGCMFLELALAQPERDKGLELPSKGQGFCWCRLSSDELLPYFIETVDVYPSLNNLLSYLILDELKPTARELLQHQYFQRVQPNSPFYSSNIMVLGKTGDGKSSFLKVLMDQLEGDSSMFEESPSPSPHTLTPCSSIKNSIKVIDTPGLQDARGIDKDFNNLEDIVTCAKAEKSINALLIVINGSSCRFDLGTQEILHLIIGSFRNNLTKNLGIVFTRASTIANEYAIASLVDEIQSRIREMMGESAVEDMKHWKIECFPERIPYITTDGIEAFQAHNHDTIVDIITWAREQDSVDVTETFAIPHQLLVERQKAVDACREIEHLLIQNRVIERNLHSEAVRRQALQAQRKHDPHNVNEVVQSISRHISRSIQSEARKFDTGAKKFFGIKTKKKNKKAVK